VLIKFRYNDWEIPQLIDLITIALELCSRVDEFRDDNVSCVFGEGSSGDSIVILPENKILVNRSCFLPLVLS
jgi:acetyl-CoA carboxylase alpha subunit